MPSCGRVNSSKGWAAPKDFLRRSRDGKGLDYKILRWCEYVAIYKAVKTKYQLTFTNNDRKLLSDCVGWLPDHIKFYRRKKTPAKTEV